MTRTIVRGLLATALAGAALFAATGTASAAESHYEGTACAGHTLYEVHSQTEGTETVFWYTAVGSC